MGERYTSSGWRIKRGTYMFYVWIEHSDTFDNDLASIAAAKSGHHDWPPFTSIVKSTVIVPETVRLLDL